MKRRRKRNRKKQAQGFVFPVPLALFLVMVTVTSMAYLWMHGRCEAAGMRIQKLERQKERTHQQLLDEQRKWAQLVTLRNVERQVAHFGLNMDWPPSSRVVHLARPVDPADRDVLPVYGELAHLAGSGHE